MAKSIASHAMKLTSIPQLARNVNRLREVLTILSKYGLADWIARLDVEFMKGLFKSSEGSRLADLTRERRIRLAITELGPTFIKLGQLLSTRSDLIGPTLAAELSQLQTATPADPPDVVRATIEAELGQPVDELFVDFDEVPIASASIGQVHRARLKSGEEVVLKVQHAGIENKIRDDLEILVGLADLAEEHLPELQNYRPRATAAEFQRTLRRELDFGREERNLLQFQTNFAGDPTVCFPRPYPELSTGRVLTMDFLDGIKLSDHEALVEANVDLAAVAQRGAEIFLEMIFDHGFYHADPHPGNMVVLPGGVIGLLDCGMVGRIDDRTREQIEGMLVALASRDAAQLATIITRIGSIPSSVGAEGLEYDIHEFVAHYADQPLNQFDLGGALTEMLEIIRRYEILLPGGVAMLIKVLIMLEGTGQLLHPDFNLTELIRPYHRKLMMRVFSPIRKLKKWRRMYDEWEHLGEILPRGLGEILNQVQAGRFEVHLQHRGLEPSVNRLVLGMLTSALFLGCALMLTRQFWPTIGGVSVFGALGAGISLALGLRLIRAINKSGHLD